MTRKDERRPRAGAPSDVLSVRGESNRTSVPPATGEPAARCRRRLTAAASVARGVGPECWRRALGSLRATPPDAWRARLDVDRDRVVRIVLEPVGGVR